MATASGTLLALPDHASAQLYWDANGTAAGAGSATPAGNWGSDSWWNTEPDGTSGGGFGSIGPWVPGEFAHFAAGGDATGAYSVAVVGTQDAQGVAASEGSVTINGSGIRLVGGFSPQFNVAAGARLTIESTLSATNTQPFVKTGAGTLVLGTVLNQPNTYANGFSFADGVTEFQGESSGVAGQPNALGAAPAAATPGALVFTNGASLRSFRTGSASFVVPNRGIRLDNPGGGTLDVAQPAASLTYAGVIAGMGRLTKDGPGELRLTGANTYRGGTTIRNGAVSFAGDPNTSSFAANPLGAYPSVATPGHILLDGGTLRTGNNGVTSSALVGSFRGIAIGAGGGVFDVTNGSAFLVYAGAIANGAGVTSGTVTKTGPGDLRLSGANAYTTLVISGGTLAVGSAASLGTGDVVLSGGTFRATDPVDAPAKSVVVNAAGGTINLASGAATTFGAIAGPGSLAKIGAGQLTASHVRVGALSVSAGTLRIADNASAGGASVVESLAVTGAAKFDVRDNKLIVRSGAVGTFDIATGEYSGVSRLIQTGRNGGAWTGAGLITSRTDAATGLTSLAVAAAGDVGYAGATFAGQTVDGGDVLVMYTYGGDADLNGTLDSDDYFAIDSNFNLSGSVFGWTKGDFDYNGAIDSDDYFIIDSNFNNQVLGQFSTAAGATATGVPEPAAAACAAILITQQLRRRRRPRGR